MSRALGLRQSISCPRLWSVSSLPRMISGISCCIIWLRPEYRSLNGVDGLRPCLAPTLLTSEAARGRGRAGPGRRGARRRPRDDYSRPPAQVLGVSFVVIHYVTKLTEVDRNFEYRRHACRMTRHVQGAVTQPMVDELWRYLVAEAREVHGVGQTSANKAAAKSQSKQPQQQSAPHNVPQGAGDVPEDTAEKVDPQPKAKAKAKARAKSKGAGKGKNSEKKTAKNDDVEDSKDGSSSGKGAGKRRPCTFFNNGQGCKSGALCEFKHKELTPKDGRCFNCGSKSHTKPDCPAPKKDGKQAAKGSQ